MIRLRQIDISRVLLLLILVSFLTVGGSFAAVDENINTFKIRKVGFVGVEHVDKKALAESLMTGAPPFWRFWESHPVVRINDLDDDLLRIRHFYQARGYYQATAEYKITAVDSEYDIEFHVTEGPPVIIHDLAVDCMCELETLTEAKIRSSLLIHSGEIFETEAYEQSKKVVRKLLGNRGYPFAAVRGSATVDLNDNSVDVIFDIDPGQLYDFGDIHITGHEDYVREKNLRRAITFKSGEQFATQKIEESRRNLFDLNIFETAVIHTGEPETEKNTVPVGIQVKPRKKQSVKFGVGYGTDDGLRLQAAWSYRNLTGRADRLTLRARRSDILENINAEYLVPYFLSAHNNLVSTGGFKREEKDYYTLQKTSAEVNFYRKLDAQWFSTFGYNLEINRPDDVRVEDSEGLVDPRDTENYLVSAVKFSLERNTVDDVLNSRKGSSINFSIENASGYLGSEISYVRPGIEARIFVPLPWEMVLAGRMNARTIQKSGDTDYIPISKQLFLGGSKSVRGFGFEKLGVIDKNDVIQDVSGLSSITGNIELRFPVYKDFGGVVFCDAGALYEDAFTFHANAFRYTSGLGLRYNTVIGPIQLDFGYQLNPAKSTATDDPLLIDLLNKDRWYLHFNIGQTF